MTINKQLGDVLWYITGRLKERGTWIALSSAFTGFGVAIKPDQWQAIMTVGMGMSGLIAAFLPPNIPEKDVVPAQAHEPTTPLAQSLADKVVSGQTDTNIQAGMPRYTNTDTNPQAGKPR